jgi:hypothetical protein
MNLAELFVELGVKVDEASFERAKEAENALGKGLLWVAGAAAFLAAGAGRLTEKIIETNVAILHQSQATGTSAEAFQELSYAAGIAGLSQEEFSVALAHLAKNMQTSKDSTSSTADAFKRLGIKVTDAHGALRPAEDVIEDMADSFSTMPDSSTKTAAAIEMFGRSGARMIPLLNKGREGLAELRREFQESGAEISGEALKSSEEAEEAFKSLGLTVRGALTSAVVDLIPTIKAAANELREWVKAHRADLVVVFSTAVKILGVLFHVLLAVLKPIIATLAVLARLFNYIAIVLGGALLAALVADGLAFGALGLAAYQAGLAMVAAAIETAAAWVVAAAPFLLILAILGLIVLLAEDVWVGMHGGKSFFGLIFNWIDKIPTMLKDGIVKALNWWYDKFFEFFDWLGNKINHAIDMLNPFNINDTSSSGTRGATAGGSADADRAFLLSRGIAPSIPTVSFPGRGGGAPTVVVGGATVHVHGVTDPKAVGEVVDRKLADHASRQAEELHGALGGR